MDIRTFVNRGACLATAVVTLAFTAEPGQARPVTFKNLYSFCSKVSDHVCLDGESPSGVILDAQGNLYGTAEMGGAKNFGVVFEIIGHREKLLYEFCREEHCIDGANPVAALIADANGNLYGTTESGGKHGRGVVFELELNASTGKYVHHVLYNFCSRTACEDGDTPLSAVLMDSDGNLYGTASFDGKGKYGAGGTVYELMKDGTTGKWIEKTIYQFCSEKNCLDGETPYASLVMDASGNLYSTTLAGGYAFSDPFGGITSGGVAFELTKNATTGKWAETVLHRFCSQTTEGGYCNDGWQPQAGLVFSGPNTLYGTTYYGGATNGNESVGEGLVFSLTLNSGSWQFAVVHPFCNAQDGPGCPTYPTSAPIVVDGSLYGTSSAGGEDTNFGVIYNLSTGGTDTPIYDFCAYDCSKYDNGGVPFAGLVADSSGHLYGTTQRYGLKNTGGEVFELTP
jgi:uncharacterized repeat protein (TIGR03803 family)